MWWKGRAEVIRRVPGVLLLILAAGLWLGAQAPSQSTAPASKGNMSAVPDASPGSDSALTGATVPSSNPRVQKLASQLLCMCGCTQILNECTHQGTDRCMTHDTMMAELEHRVANGESDSLILQSFVQEYGPAVLVVPPARGFDLTAWLMPLFASLAGLTLALVVVRRWRERGMKPAKAAAGNGSGNGAGNMRVRPDLLERARAETKDEDY
jgi:cytochrome c-type biogenesis protein CcmH/NrfF